MPSNASVLKEINELKLLKIRDFVTLQQILFADKCLEEQKIKSFSSIFKRSQAVQYHNTRPKAHTN